MTRVQELIECLQRIKLEEQQVVRELAEAYKKEQLQESSVHINANKFDIKESTNLEPRFQSAKSPVAARAATRTTTRTKTRAAARPAATPRSSGKPQDWIT